MFSQRGCGGELRAGAVLAARFGDWAVVRPDDTLGSRVALVTVDALRLIDVFRFEHDALDLWLDCGAAWWIWRKVQCTGPGAWRTRGEDPEIRVK